MPLFEAHRRFFITTHTRPDGDALGSQIALGRFLRKLGKDVTLINCDAAPYHLEWLPDGELVEVFDSSLDQRTRIDEAEVMLIVDVNTHKRLGSLSGPIKANGGVKVLIDHHTHPEDWFDLVYRREHASSTGELVYELIMEHAPDLIDAEIATLLYTAIMTDTGSFRYSSVTPAVHRVVADLLERGDITPAPIHTELYDQRSLASLRLLSMALATITLRYDGIVGYMVLTHDMIRDAGATPDDAGGLVQYVLSIESVQAALLFKEHTKGTKISFRSIGDVHVNEWARSFAGGGHNNASGAFVNRPMQETIRAVLEAAPRYLDVTEDAPRELTEADADYLAELMKEGGG